MSKQFIEQQQELVTSLEVDRLHTRDGKAWMCEDDVKHLIKEVITNTGEELMQLAEGEKRDPANYLDPRNVTQHNQALDTMKQHITNLTGVEK